MFTEAGPRPLEIWYGRFARPARTLAGRLLPVLLAEVPKLLVLGHESFELFFSVAHQIGFVEEARRSSVAVAILFTATPDQISVEAYRSLRDRFAQTTLAPVHNEMFGPAQHGVVLGELLAAKLAGRVHARPRLVDDHIGRAFFLARGAPAHLVLDDLARQLQVSRTPVRVALTRLVGEGLVQPAGRMGYQVVQQTPEALRNLYDVRLMCESFAVERGIENVTPEFLQQLDRWFEMAR